MARVARLAGPLDFILGRQRAGASADERDQVS
jgi:hypothetical protein